MLILLCDCVIPLLTYSLICDQASAIDNPGPGTVVDHNVTARHLFDFYLVSQHVNQGTVSPTHYIVLRDAGYWPPDVLQKLSYKACHLYYNWCGTVRVPAPVQVSARRATGGQILVKVSAILRKVRATECVVFNRVYTRLIVHLV